MARVWVGLRQVNGLRSGWLVVRGRKDGVEMGQLICTQRALCTQVQIMSIELFISLPRTSIDSIQAEQPLLPTYLTRSSCTRMPFKPDRFSFRVNLPSSRNPVARTHRPNDVARQPALRPTRGIWKDREPCASMRPDSLRSRSLERRNGIQPLTYMACRGCGRWLP